MTCRCSSCTPREGPCTACGGTGEVESIADGPRPCSRCRGHQFDQWKARRMAQHAADQASEKR